MSEENKKLLSEKEEAAVNGGAVNVKSSICPHCKKRTGVHYGFEINKAGQDLPMQIKFDYLLCEPCLGDEMYPYLRDGYYFVRWINWRQEQNGNS